MIPVFGILGLVAAGLTRFLGCRLVIILSLIGFVALSVDSVISSSPLAQLKRVTGHSQIPAVDFERFEQGQTFSDGTSYLWIARCNSVQALELVGALELQSIPREVPYEPGSPMMMRQGSVSTYEGVFGDADSGVMFYVDPRGMIAGFSESEQRFRLYWWPAALEKETTEEANKAEMATPRKPSD